MDKPGQYNWTSKNCSTCGELAHIQMDYVWYCQECLGGLKLWIEDIEKESK